MDLPHHLRHRQEAKKIEKLQLLLSLLVSLSHSSAKHADHLYHISGFQKHLLQLQRLLLKSHYRNRGLRTFSMYLNEHFREELVGWRVVTSCCLVSAHGSSLVLP